LPAAVWHQHEEDVHAMAVAAHDETHFCELELLVCNSHSPLTDCHHQAHIEKGHSKCFSCQFHFIKHFDFAKAISASIQCTRIIHRIFYSVRSLAVWAKNISNKGPPALV